MNVALRADASGEAGTGHVARCLTLAVEFLRRGHTATLVTRRLAPTLTARARTAGCDVVAIGEGDDAEETVTAVGRLGRLDLMIVDHYRFGADWERHVAGSAQHLMVIDDLADRVHVCALLLDQNLFGNAAARYEGLISPGTVLLLGPDYALLRPEFARARAAMSERTGSIRRVLVTYGGSDPNADTERTVHAVRRALPSAVIDAVLGGSSERTRSVQESLCSMAGVELYLDTREMSALIAGADLCVGAAGGTTWERCCLGLPSLVVATADTQIEPSRQLDNAGAVRYLGTSAGVSNDMLVEAIRDASVRPEMLRSLSRIGMSLVDGLGAGRCVDATEQLIDFDGRTRT
jgi:UDP-2,4-diacetamido-2,4,6-trideoxy-beta-L-altropyranose hydrolase